MRESRYIGKNQKNVRIIFLRKQVNETMGFKNTKNKTYINFLCVKTQK